MLLDPACRNEPVGAVNERVLGRIMPVFHAFFSFGTVIGAALGPGRSHPAPHRGAPADRGRDSAGGAPVSVRFLQSEHIIAEDAVAYMTTTSKTLAGAPEHLA
jgi:hypothetical protein